MKKTLLTLLTLFSATFAYSQSQPWQTSNSNIYFNTGNVGIGTGTPGAKVEIKGNGASIFLDNNQLSVNRNPLTGLVVDATLGSSVISMPTTSNGGIVQFYTSSVTGGNVVERMRITENGNIGIGTSLASAKLSIQGTQTYANTGAQAVADVFGVYDRTRLTIGNTTTTQGGTRSSAVTFYSMNAGGNAYKMNWEVGNDVNVKGVNDFYIFSGDLGNAPFYISAIGNVGIGSTLPGDYKLAVAGPMHTQSVQVDMIGWHDDVFNSSYALKPLPSVKNYIDQNHHLPDMPSESEVIKAGIDLGKMESLQMKKIEELTLYLIEKDRQLTEQQNKNKQLEERIAALEKVMLSTASNTKKQ
jgi:hypothetical protein